LISTLTLISIIGVTIGTALLIVVLSVFNGFYDVIRGILLTNDPDIRIESVAENSIQANADFLNNLTDISEITAITPYVSGKSMLAFKDQANEVVTVHGIEKETFIRVNDLNNSISTGIFDLSVQNGRPGILIGEQLRARFRLKITDEIALLSSSGMRRALTQFSVPRVNRYQVRGTFFTQQILPDDIVYIDLEAAQILFNMRNRVSGFDIRLDSPDNAEAVKIKLQRMLGDEYNVMSWYDLQKSLYDVMYLEKWISYFVLMLIVIVAVLNIVGSLTMIVIQKRRDIGILLSMGMTPASIKKIFRLQGLYIGLIGCLIGGALGLFLSWAQLEYGIVSLSSAFIIDAYPVSINISDIIIVLTGSMVLCITAGWYPSVRAASIAPADVVRSE
jgi:lipoprotein-releasing system permease protein